jgi:hypothetical protein
MRVKQPIASGILALLCLVLIAGVALRLTPGNDASATRTPSAVPAAKIPVRAESKRDPFPLGLTVRDPGAFLGYTLVASMTSPHTYLIDLDGRVVRSWESSCSPALGACLLENGHLLRPGAHTEVPHGLSGPGGGGRIQEFDWDGSLVWDYTFAPEKMLPHHDVAPLPSGNVLAIVWEEKSAAEALAAGRKPELIGDGHLVPDALFEVKPTGKTTGQIVWEWHVWDHLIQDHDSSRANFGDVAAHPERIDVNFGDSPMPTVVRQPGGMDALRSIGYAGASASTKRSARMDSDWTHLNAVAYSVELDQVMVTVHAFSEIWIIDHSTTTAEAAGHSGGRYGRGGDLLCRWGNPQAYRAGKPSDQKLFFPHGAHWIPPRVPGAGNILVFNNGAKRPDGPFSSVDEIALLAAKPGFYASARGGLHEPARFGPSEPVWTYIAPRKIDFYSMLLSGAQRLPNGNTLICSGMNGTVFEVTPEKKIVWQYTCPVPNDASRGMARNLGGFGPPGGSSLFRAPRYGPDHSALSGKDLTPGKTIEELHPRRAPTD